MENFYLSTEEIRQLQVSKHDLWLARSRCSMLSPVLVLLPNSLNHSYRHDICCIDSIVTSFCLLLNFPFFFSLPALAAFSTFFKWVCLVMWMLRARLSMNDLAQTSHQNFLSSAFCRPRSTERLPFSLVSLTVPLIMSRCFLESLCLSV